MEASRKAKKAAAVQAAEAAHQKVQRLAQQEAAQQELERLDHQAEVFQQQLQPIRSSPTPKYVLQHCWVSLALDSTTGTSSVKATCTVGTFSSLELEVGLMLGKPVCEFTIGHLKDMLAMAHIKKPLPPKLQSMSSRTALSRAVVHALICRRDVSSEDRFAQFLRTLSGYIRVMPEPELPMQPEQAKVIYKQFKEDFKARNKHLLMTWEER